MNVFVLISFGLNTVSFFTLLVQQMFRNFCHRRDCKFDSFMTEITCMFYKSEVCSSMVYVLLLDFDVC